MNYQEIPLKQIKPSEKAIKKHDKNQIQKIANSIENLSQYRPILIQKSSMSIICGHSIYYALKKLKRKTALVYIIDVTDEKAQEIAFTDNYTNQSSEWDYEKLQYLFSETDNSILKYSGFENKEIEKIFNEDPIVENIFEYHENQQEQPIEENTEKPEPSEEDLAQALPQQDGIIFKKVFFCSCCNKYYDISTMEEVTVPNN